MRALVADDDGELLSLVTQALERHQITVVAVQCGGDLLEAIANNGPFDLIVTDVQMPWMTGLHVMHTMRSAGLPVPVVVMTALRDPTIPHQVAQLGGHAVLLQKPFTLARLYSAIDRCLGVAEDARITQ
jgi:two-component system cell cycle sensor histidine kinase/response regulator CckA